LPKKIQFGTLFDTGNTIEYFYDATDVKLKKVVTMENGVGIKETQYSGAFIYESNNSALSLKFISQPEGYIEPDNQGNFDYIFQYKDHLGNIRLSYKDSNNDGSVDSSEIIEENNYYPFGLEHKGYNNVVTSTNPAQNYKFNQGTSDKNFQGKEGKSFKVERQLDLGLNLDMTKFRTYDYTLGRFTSVDQLANSSPQESLSPYQYAFNSPIQYNDPYGDCPECWDFIKNAWESISVTSVSISLGAGFKFSNTGYTGSVAKAEYNIKTNTFSFTAINGFTGVGDSKNAVKSEVKIAYASKNFDTNEGEGGFVRRRFCSYIC
jgi:RHS repeat-associated protein